jgi:hypothetical protein
MNFVDEKEMSPSPTAWERVGVRVAGEPITLTFILSLPVGGEEIRFREH